MIPQDLSNLLHEYQDWTKAETERLRKEYDADEKNTDPFYGKAFTFDGFLEWLDEVKIGSGK